jgi:hypothetical protein
LTKTKEEAMSSWFIILNILLLLSSPFLQARFRANSKRRYSTATKYFVPPPLPSDDNSIYPPDGDSLTESTTWSKNQANEQQIEEFTRILYDRLDLKEPPNVTMHVHDGTGIPSSIVKQLENHQRHHHNEVNSFPQQKNRDDIQGTTERAILPGDSIPHHTCQLQLVAKFNLNKENSQSIDCFRFAKSPIDSKSLPTNQLIKQIRIYIKKNYFHFNDERQHTLTPDMFQIYQVFRPTANDTSSNPFHSLTGTIRLSISQVKQLNNKWFELTIDSYNQQISLEQIYKQFIMPWYGLGMNHVLQTNSWSSYYRRYHSKNNPENFLGSDDDDDDNKESQQELPYMLVEYGEKIVSSSGNRATRGAHSARPARTCDPKSPCCRRPLIIDLDQGHKALNFVIYPRQIDIGECVGLCGISGSSLQHTKVKNGQHSGYNIFALYKNSLNHNQSTTAKHTNKADQPSTNCCSYSRTGGIDVMYTTTNDGPIIRKFIPNMIVEECRCGLPAII